MRFLDAEFVKGFIRMANDGWEQGWHERNGGNLSYRVKADEVESVRENFEPKEWQTIGTTVPILSGEYFLVTGSGKYFRNVIIKPEDSICMIELDEKGENYRIVWGLVNGGRPTSELPSHLMNLEVKKLQNPNYRVVYHAHTTNIIALTFVLPLEDKVFTRELWEMATECPVVFPDGIGVVPWMVPGGREIAVAVKRAVLTLPTTSSWHRSSPRQNPTICRTIRSSVVSRRLLETATRSITNSVLMKATVRAEPPSS